MIVLVFFQSRLEKDQNDQIKIIRQSSYSRIFDLLVGQETSSPLVDDRGEALLEANQEITGEALKAIPQMYWNVIDVGSDVSADTSLPTSITFQYI